MGLPNSAAQFSPIDTIEILSKNYNKTESKTFPNQLFNSDFTKHLRQRIGGTTSCFVKKYSVQISN